MDEYIARKEHEEFCRRMATENARLDDENNRQNKRISALEETVRQVNELTLSVREMAVSMSRMLEEQKKQGERLETLESRDGQMWRKVVEYAVMAAVGGPCLPLCSPM